MNKNKIFAIFILFAVLITCAGVSFASSDFDSNIGDSVIGDLNYGLDDDLGDGLDDDIDDEELEEDFEDDIYDDSDEDDSDDDFDDEDDLDDESDDDDLDDEDDWDDDSDDWDDDLDDEDDWDDDLDDEDDWDDDSDDWDDDLDDEDDWDDDWEYGDIGQDIYYYDDLDFGYWEYEDIDWNEFYNETSGNVTIAKRILFYKTGLTAKFNETNNRTYFTYLTYAKTCSNHYGTHTSDEEELDNTTDSDYETEYKQTFLAGCMPSLTEDMNRISACYESPLLKSMDLGDIKEGFVLDESQNNETDDKVKSEGINVNIIPENTNILALLALIIICLVAIL